MRDRWLRALRDAVPRLALALGARINCTDVKYREHAGAFLATSGCAANEALDLLAAFATDACLLERSDIVEPTPPCFIKESSWASSSFWTPSGNSSAKAKRTFFTCAPTRRGLGTTGWSTVDDEQVFTWPIWDWPACPDTIRSLLQLGELARPDPDRTHLLARGVTASFRARRIRVPPTGSNYKLNFSPARTV